MTTEVMFDFATGPWWVDASTGVSAAATVATALIAVLLSVQLRLRERRQALAELHKDLTSGEIAAARDKIGTLFYSEKYGAGMNQRTTIEAYFHLIWAIQRSRNVFRVQHYPWKLYLHPAEGAAQSKEVGRALSWNLDEIVKNVHKFKVGYSTDWSVADSDAWDDLTDYLGDTIEGCDPATCPHNLRGTS